MNPNDFEIIKTRDKIFELAKDNPVVYTALMYHFRGDITFEQAMMTAINIMDKQITFLKQDIVNRINSSTERIQWQTPNISGV